MPKLQDPFEVTRIVKTKNFEDNLFLRDVHTRVLAVLRMAETLSPQYYVVVANPPYKKKADLNDFLQDYLESQYTEGKYDLYQAFIFRNLSLLSSNGYVGMITMQGWMFAPRFEAIRTALLSSATIHAMVQLGERAFDSIGGEVVSTTAFILNRSYNILFKGDFVRITKGQNEVEKTDDLLSAAASSESQLRFRVSGAQFKKIPGTPLIYWAKEKFVICSQPIRQFPKKS